jgi:hypothetical protein
MATDYIPQIANEHPPSPVISATAGPTLVDWATSAETNIACDQGWERVRRIISASQRRIRKTATDSPLSFILGVGVVAFGIGIALRIWRSNSYAGNQFFGKWRT